MKINKKQFNKWIAALRSGKYKQSKFYLQSFPGFCCLGVACDVLIPKRKQKRRHWKLAGAVPSHQPHAPLWLKEINRDFITKTKYDLIDLNDKLDFTFDEIADLLELVYIHKALG